MYDELIKVLHETDFSDGCPCGAEPMCKDRDCVILQAAEAIEELQAQLMYSNDAAKAIAEKVPKWIPVTERLPEKCGRYIALLKASEDETKRWIEWGLGDDADIILEMLYDADQKIWKTDYGAYNAILSVVNREHDSCVTHWMPLPKPPKGAE